MSTQQVNWSIFDLNPYNYNEDVSKKQVITEFKKFDGSPEDFASELARRFGYSRFMCELVRDWCRSVVKDEYVFPITVDGKQYYISSQSKTKLIAFPEHQQYPASHTYLKVDSMYNTDSADKESVNPTPELMDNVLTNVYSELAEMKSDYDKGELPDSSLHFEEALKQLQRLKLWG